MDIGGYGVVLHIKVFFFCLSVCRTKASRLAEENHVLGQKLAALKEEGLKETEEELRSETKSFSISRSFSCVWFRYVKRFSCVSGFRQTLQQLSEEKTAAQKEVESCNKQVHF